MGTICVLFIMGTICVLFIMGTICVLFIMGTICVLFIMGTICVLLCPFGSFHSPTDIQIVYLSNLLSMSVSDEDYS
jgi:predicted membrane metal-binding protein